MRSQFLSLIIAAIAGLCGGPAALQAGEDKTLESAFANSAIVYNIIADEIPNPAPDTAVRINVLGTEHAGKDAPGGRLGLFGYAYAWESRGAYAECRKQWQIALDTFDSSARSCNERFDRVSWTFARTTPQGFATIPLPRDRVDRELLHVFPLEPGWGLYPSPGAIDPAALQGAQVYYVADAAKGVHFILPLVRAPSSQPQVDPTRAHRAFCLQHFSAPCRPEAFDFQRHGPGALLAFLRTAKTPFEVTHSHAGWLQPRDIAPLLRLVDSRQSCARIANANLGAVPLDRTTVGETALFLLDSLRAGTFPGTRPYSGNVDAKYRAEILDWARQRQTRPAALE
ncbi:MAG: hypothetical protein IT467_08890 [Dokdonella sp.]|nr:hypothetical protein [Dokdonella sp.]